ncbi:MAG: hypothetical protein H6773_04335 [Pseudomonadales bacterium]|nr:hypothetical protein [Candidatus Woesebacteria bacterium]MCB9801384.1 hypothetical protein [Pseudomonadales bacterium]
MKRCIESYQSEHRALNHRGKNAVLATKEYLKEYALTQIEVADSQTNWATNSRPVVELNNFRSTDTTAEQRFFQPIIPSKIIDESTESSYNSEVTHSDQMDINALYLSLLGILAGEIPVDAEFKETLLDRASALLFGEASIAHFAVQSNLNQAYNSLYPNGLKYVDAGKLDHYVLTAQSFYAILANRGVPTVDIHDFVHHAAQFRQWPEFYIPLYNIAALINDALREDDINNNTPLYKVKQLVSFISFATAEYSIVADGNPQNNYSFGCLLYQYPRKSPMSQVNLLTDGVSPREFTHWNSVRALMSLQRRVLEARHLFGNDIHWLNQLGYQLPEQYHPTLSKNGKTLHEPLRHVPREHQLDFGGLRFPDGPIDLFENATTLLLSEVQHPALLHALPQTSQSTLEEWTEVLRTQYGKN